MPSPNLVRLYLYVISEILNSVNSPPIFTSPVKEVPLMRHSSCRTAPLQMTTRHWVLICTVLKHSKIYSCKVNIAVTRSQQ